MDLYLIVTSSIAIFFSSFVAGWSIYWALKLKLSQTIIRLRAIYIALSVITFIVIIIANTRKEIPFDVLTLWCLCILLCIYTFQDVGKRAFIKILSYLTLKGTRTP